MSQCIRCRIRGRVQGVWYRASTQEQAVRFGITGYARNMYDGSVEVLACGEKAALDKLKAWLWDGPRAAEVTEVACDVVDAVAVSGFVTG